MRVSKSSTFEGVAMDDGEHEGSDTSGGMARVDLFAVLVLFALEDFAERRGLVRGFALRFDGNVGISSSPSTSIMSSVPSISV